MAKNFSITKYNILFISKVRLFMKVLIVQIVKCVGGSTSGSSETQPKTSNFIIKII